MKKNKLTKLWKNTPKVNWQLTYMSSVLSWHPPKHATPCSTICSLNGQIWYCPKKLCLRKEPKHMWLGTQNLPPWENGRNIDWPAKEVFYCGISILLCVSSVSDMASTYILNILVNMCCEQMLRHWFPFVCKAVTGHIRQGTAIAVCKLVDKHMIHCTEQWKMLSPIL